VLSAMSCVRLSVFEFASGARDSWRCAKCGTIRSQSRYSLAGFQIQITCNLDACICVPARAYPSVIVHQGSPNMVSMFQLTCIPARLRALKRGTQRMSSRNMRIHHCHIGPLHVPISTVCIFLPLQCSLISFKLSVTSTSILSILSWLFTYCNVCIRAYFLAHAEIFDSQSSYSQQWTF